jgi:hypothetical protein
MSSRVGVISKMLVLDIFGSVAWFPVWWYTIGLRRVFLGSISAVKYRARTYSLKIWIKNFFVPMYGQYDFFGRLVSVFMRFVVLIAKVFALIVEAVIYAFGVIAWVFAPIVFAVFVFISLSVTSS